VQLLKGPVKLISHLTEIGGDIKRRCKDLALRKLNMQGRKKENMMQAKRV
jgi:hypothetical protein